jgi:hypothetical protein
VRADIAKFIASVGGHDAVQVVEKTGRCEHSLLSFSFEHEVFFSVQFLRNGVYFEQDFAHREHAKTAAEDFATLFGLREFAFETFDEEEVVSSHGIRILLDLMGRFD